ncbi:unnamed protein product, partial [Brenthis ino]
MDEMDILWSKEKLHKIFSKDSLPLKTAHASGDAGVSIRCCRLCGDDANLSCFSDTFIWEGVKERYDKLLYDCFGIRVFPADSMICERCVRQLRNAQRFRALVQAAFTRPPSEYSTYRSQLGVGESFTKNKKKRKSTHELLKKSTRTTVVGCNKKRKLNERKTAINSSNVQVRRINIACTMCNHKYPMIVPFEGWKKFVCSRCKKNSEPRTGSFRKYATSRMTPLNTRDRSNLNAKTDLREKSRVCSLPKKPSQITKQESFLRPKYQCSQCNKKYLIAQHLNHHVESVHTNLKNIDYLCAVCGKDMNTKDLLERHMRMHTGQPIYQCDVCMRVFKGRRAFQTHYLTHGK